MSRVRRLATILYFSILPPHPLYLFSLAPIPIYTLFPIPFKLIENEKGYKNTRIVQKEKTRKEWSEWLRKRKKEKWIEEWKKRQIKGEDEVKKSIWKGTMRFITMRCFVCVAVSVPIHVKRNTWIYYSNEAWHVVIFSSETRKRKLAISFAWLTDCPSCVQVCLSRVLRRKGKCDNESCVEDGDRTGWLAGLCSLCVHLCFSRYLWRKKE